MTSVTVTSRAAYRSPRHDNTQKQKLINALALHGPRSNAELGALTGLPPNVVPPRVGELREAGVVKLVGEEPRGVDGAMVLIWGLNI